MPSFNEIAVRLYRRLSPASKRQTAAAAADSALDGNSAVAHVEARIADVATLSRAYPANGASWTWQRASAGLIPPRESLAAESPRGALAAAIGQTMAGRRACACFSGAELAANQDLLANAAGRHVPLVIHLNNLALPSQGSTLGSGHEALHQAAESGCFTLFASNVQEAADFTLIARRVAEEALIPGLVVMDVDRTALSVQELNLPTDKLISNYLGVAEARIDSPTPAQQLLFGATRRRLPRWHDLQRPLLQGSMQTPHAFALGVAGSRPYFGQHLQSTLDNALDQYHELSGRRYNQLVLYQMKDAKLVLLVQGAAFESVKRSADYLRSRHKLKVGAIGLHCLRPFPGAELVKALTGKRDVLVLERLDTPLAEDPPLMREIRAAISRGLDNDRFGQESHPGYAPIDESQLPSLHSAIYGIGGLPLLGADLVSHCRNLKSNAPSLTYLGLEFHNISNVHPKRQVLLDQIRRAYPSIEKLGVRETEAPPNSEVEGALSLAVHRPSGQDAEVLTAETAVLLQRLNGGHLRTLTGFTPDDWADWITDRLCYTPATPCDADDMLQDAALVIGAKRLKAAFLHTLKKGGLLLITGSKDDNDLWNRIGTEARELIKQNKCRLYHCSANETEQNNQEQRDAYYLGTLFAALSNSGLLNKTERQIEVAWEAGLDDMDESERETLVSNFKSGMDALQQVQYDQLETGLEPAPSSWSDEAPKVVRRLGSGEETFDSLPRFWDQVGILYRDDESSDLTADPFMTTGLVPPLSASFRDMSERRDWLPVFDPAACSGCGDCWRTCPDSAIGVTALTPAALLDFGIKQAKADSVRQVASKLASQISTLGRNGESEGATVEELLEQAWEWLQAKSPLPAERKQAIQTELDNLLEHIGPLPVAITEPLFQQGEKVKKDGGELLALVINPYSCKACTICTTNCETGALQPIAQVNEHLSHARRLWRIWEETPDTSSDTIERIAAEGVIDPMASLLMSRHCGQAMAGGDGAEAGSGEKIALRMAMATAEYLQQPRQQRLTSELGELHDKISGQINEILTDALPTDDLERLADNLRTARSRQIDLSSLTKQTGINIGEGIDTQHLSRLVELTQDLGEARWELSAGHHGLGRARFGLAITPGTLASWAGAFPNNPFQAPVTLDTSGATAQLAAGLLQGQLAEAVATLDLLQRARVELDKRSKTEFQPRIWASLSQEERQLCPPLFLVGSETELGGRAFAQVAWLLNTDLPIKILVMSELDMGLESPARQERSLAKLADPLTSLGLMALAQRRAYVAQTSIAAPEHFHQSLCEALSFTGPALIRMHTPSPQRHGFAPYKTVEQARQAVACRAFPLFRYQPKGEGVFGLRISLEGNPEPRLDWVNHASEQPLTPLMWALEEGRFTHHFTPINDTDPASISINDWLQLDAAERENKPAVLSMTVNGEQIRYQISNAMMASIEETSHVWRTLQELAGLVTPFTEMVNRDAEARVASERQAELDALKQEHEKQLHDLQQELQGTMAEQVKSQLLELAGYRRASGS